MRVKIIITGTLLLLCSLFALWDIMDRPPPTIIQQPNEEIAGTPSPPFTFMAFDGKNITSQSLMGKVVLLNFWASWCTPCLAEFPDLLKLAAQYPDDLILVALSVDENPNNARAFIKKIGAPSAKNIIIGFDTDKKISQDLFQTTLYPESYILTPDLQIVRHIIGTLGPDDTAALQSLINK